MKLKGLTKLALSGVALAAVAATLGTSTYAWYVSNSKAEVNNISGQSNATTAGSLLINKLKNASGNVAADSATWTNKVEYSSLVFKNAPSLDPVTRDGDDYVAPASKTATGFHKIDGDIAAISDYVGYFLIGIKTSDANKLAVNMTLGIENQTTTPKAQTAYLGEDKGAPTGVTAGGDSFFVDFVKSLKFDFNLQPLTAQASTAYIKNVDDEDDQLTGYNAETFKNLAQNGAYSPLANAVSGGNAHTYYKNLSDDNVSGTSIIGGEDDGCSDYPTNGIKFNLPAKDTEYVLVVRYWLDGADTDCFDSCVGQNFMMSINFEASAE